MNSSQIVVRWEDGVPGTHERRLRETERSAFPGRVRASVHSGGVFLSQWYTFNEDGFATGSGAAIDRHGAMRAALGDLLIHESRNGRSVFVTHPRE